MPPTDDQRLARFSQPASPAPSTRPACFYWYDLETTGTHPPSDRIMQFAAQRTDANLRPLGEPVRANIRLAPDVLPSPGACLVTGITPQTVAGGVDEWQALDGIEREMLRGGTCVAGYNNLRFDDEFLRYGFYRNLIDPYAWAWRDGNSRWDLIDLARAAYALRPDGVRWPRAEQGVVSFKLADLTAENGIAHQEPHTAGADVEATIGLAQLLRAAQPKLWDYALRSRSRAAAQQLLLPLAQKVCVHTSPSYANERRCAAPVVAVARHPEIEARVIVADLSRDITPLIEEDAAALRARLFVSEDQRDGERPPLKAVALNRCPFLAPIRTVRAQDAARLGWNLDAVEQRRQTLAATEGLALKIADVYRVEGDRAPADDAELALYDGFLDDADRRDGERVRQALAGNDAWPHFAPRDERLRVLGVRLKARLRSDALDSSERESWHRHVRRCLRDGFGERPSLAAFRAELATLRAAEPSAKQLVALDELAAYADQAEAAL